MSVIISYIIYIYTYMIVLEWQKRSDIENTYNVKSASWVYILSIKRTYFRIKIKGWIKLNGKLN